MQDLTLEMPCVEEEASGGKGDKEHGKKTLSVNRGRRLSWDH